MRTQDKASKETIDGFHQEQRRCQAPHVHRRRSGRRARVPDDRQGAGDPICDALAEHLAGEGHLPRVRARLRQEGQRHDRRRAARSRCCPPARWCRPSGCSTRCPRARSTAATACWSTTTASRTRSRCGARARPSAWTPTCCSSWHKYGGGKELLNKLYALDRRERRVVPVRPDADAAARLVQEADHQGRGLQGPQVPHRRHLDRRVHRAWARR